MTSFVRRALLTSAVLVPGALAAPPAQAVCTVLPVGQAEVTYCAEGGWTCASVDTLNPDAYLCASKAGAACGVRVFNVELACA